MSDWLQDELKRSLGPARAPEALWDRIQNAKPAPTMHHWTRWAVAAVVTLTTAVGSYWLPAPQLRSDVSVLAATEPDPRPAHPAEWDLRCAPPGRSVIRVAEISTWRGHPFEEAMGCQACHSTGAKEHHL